MDQKISIKIAGRVFNLTASSPEMEELYRRAADAINARFAGFSRSHPGRSALDILSLVALNESVIRLGMQRDIDQYRNAEKQLEKDLENYLKDHSE